MSETRQTTLAAGAITTMPDATALLRAKQQRIAAEAAEESERKKYEQLCRAQMFAPIRLLLNQLIEKCAFVKRYDGARERLGETLLARAGIAEGVASVTVYYGGDYMLKLSASLGSNDAPFPHYKYGDGVYGQNEKTFTRLDEMLDAVLEWLAKHAELPG